METLLQHDKAIQSHQHQVQSSLEKKFAGTNVNGAEGALPSFYCLCKWLALPVHH